MLSEVVFETKGQDDMLLCFIHPIGTSKEIWEPIIDLLIPKFSISFIDLPGHGESELNGTFSLENSAKAVIDHLQLKNKKVIVVGHSIGGMVTQILAAQKPEFLQGIVLVSTLVKPGEEAKKSMIKRAEQVRSEGMESILQSTLERWFTRQSLEEKLPVIDLVSNLLLEAKAEVHAEAWEAISRFDGSDLLPSIQIPALVIVGDCDITTPPSVAKDIVGLCPGARLYIIPKAGHALPQESASSFAREIIGFVEGVTHDKHT